MGILPRALRAGRFVGYSGLSLAGTATVAFSIAGLGHGWVHNVLVPAAERLATTPTALCAAGGLVGFAAMTGGFGLAWYARQDMRNTWAQP